MERIPVMKPWVGDEELAKVKECFDNNWITGGPMVKEFEQEIAKLHRVKHAIACSNGTMALYMALKAVGICKGDKVIVPGFTFIASANAVVLAGGTPVFADIDARTFNLDPMFCENIIDGDTKAIMPVDIYGQSADMSAIMQVALKYGLKVIEDAAQGVGGTFDGYGMGTIGDAGCLSFYADKIMTTGEGGMVLTNDDDIADKCLRLKHQGRTGRGWYVHDSIGYNFRMTDMQAAVGLVQLLKLPMIISKRIQLNAYYKLLLSDIPQVEFPYEDKRSKGVPFRINILVDDPEGLEQWLDHCGIDTMRFFYPLHRQPAYAERYLSPYHKPFPNSDWAYEHGLSLPSWVGLSDEQVRYICEKVREYYENFDNNS